MYTCVYVCVHARVCAFVCVCGLAILLLCLTFISISVACSFMALSCTVMFSLKAISTKNSVQLEYETEDMSSLMV